MKIQSDSNLEVYQRYVGDYNSYSLDPCELEIIRYFKDGWATSRMLDIGIGTGRTTAVFSAIAGEYVGIDYCREMLTRCREVLPENESVSYLHCDARDLSRFYDNRFNYVLFSLNGLGSVGHDDRERILNEVRKALIPGGYFCFSGHSINNFSLARQIPKFKFTRPVWSTYHIVQRLISNFRLRWIYRALQLEEIRNQDWGVLKTGDHDFKIDIYHVNPTYQVQELNRLGFKVKRVINRYGQDVDLSSSGDDWLYYICQSGS